MHDIIWPIHVRAGTIRPVDTTAKPDRDALMMYGRSSTTFTILLDELVTCPSIEDKQHIHNTFLCIG